MTDFRPLFSRVVSADLASILCPSTSARDRAHYDSECSEADLTELEAQLEADGVVPWGDGT